MFFLLMQIRLLSARNVVRDTLRRHPALALGLSLLGVGLFSLTYGAVLFVFNLMTATSVLSETVYQIFYFLFLFLLAGAVPFVASTLLHSSDYTLLFSAPLSPRAVIAAKLLDATVTNSLQFTVLGVPAIAACATALGLPRFGWLLLPLLIALFVLVPALLTALALLVALSLLGMRRLRAAITVLNALMAAAVCITIVLEAPRLNPLTKTTAITALPPDLTVSSSSAHFAPSGWFAAWLLAMAKGDGPGMMQAGMALGSILLLVGALFVTCLALGERLLSAASVAEENEGGGTVPADAFGREARWWHRLFSAPVAALILKDLKYMGRDSVLMSQLAMPLILFLVPFLLALQDPSAVSRSDMFPFASAIVGVILFMQTSILSLSLLGLESRSFWVVLTSPNGGATLLWAKFILSVLVTVGVGTALTLFSGLAFAAGITVVLIQLALVALCSVALCGLGVGISAALPRFVYENPAHRVSAWALILGFFATVGYLMATAIIFGVAWILAVRVEESQTHLIYLIGAALYLALTIIATYVPMAIGARRIEVYQWEH
jgi:ABC-2 type transport system permease protein